MRQSAGTLAGMDAATFSGHFEDLVVGPALEVGFERWGKSLWMEQDGLQVAVMRTELRYTWPFKLTLLARHDCLRDFKDRVPPQRSQGPSEYPVKSPPSQARSLIDNYRYTPYNLFGFPATRWMSGGSSTNSGRSGRRLRRPCRCFPLV